MSLYQRERGYKVSTEPAMPSSNSFNLIQKSIESIRPDRITEWYVHYANIHKKRLALDLDIITKRIPKNSRLIEFGSIPPILTLALSNLKYDVVGTDIEPDRFRTVIASTALRIAKINVETEKLPFHENEFDAAIFHEIFEHLRINLIDTLGKIYKVIKPGGTLFLSTPNLLCLSGWVSFALKNKAPGDIFSEYKKLEKIGHMGHVREYTPTEVCIFLEKIGFQIDEIIFRGSYDLSTSWKQKLSKSILAVMPSLRPFFSVTATKLAH